MTITQHERDWLAALWRQAERDALTEQCFPGQWSPLPFPFQPHTDEPWMPPFIGWPNPPRLDW